MKKWLMTLSMATAMVSSVAVAGGDAAAGDLLIIKEQGSFLVGGTMIACQEMNRGAVSNDPEGVHRSVDSVTRHSGLTHRVEVVPARM